MRRTRRLLREAGPASRAGPDTWTWDGHDIVVRDEPSHAPAHRGRDRRRRRVRAERVDAGRYGHEVSESESLTRGPGEQGNRRAREGRLVHIHAATRQSAADGRALRAEVAQWLLRQPHVPSGRRVAGAGRG